ncbi:MAG: cytochrome c [Pseudomonadota bacterium]|nr:cytochrome c [Pseudomonadota bacterium]MEC8046772.1 cytochrome c [Pseudomonadota bacterium]MEC8059295.1 cytochrome c [Pseudomonadota bacterium]MED6342704.1 cytochrome c [Pseudomonadota bacterium]
MRLIATATVLVLMLSGCDDTTGQKAKTQVTGSVYHLMAHYLEPAADKIWGSAGFVITEDGEVDLQPTTDDGWFAVEHAAIVVAEGGNLLMLDGYAADQADWAEYAQGLTRAALKARDAAEQQDADALFAAGGEVYSVCRACHNRYMINAADE